MTYVMTGPDIWSLYRNGEPYTLIVYGLPGGTWDVEIHEDHVDEVTRDARSYLGGHTLARNTHIVQDMWDAVTDAMVQRENERQAFRHDPFGEPPVWWIEE